MIIYGSKAVHLTSAQSNATCPSCGKQGSIVLSVFSKHAHIFWIPLFPIGKTGVSQCQHCKNVLRSNEMPESIKHEYNPLERGTGIPKWQFAGIGILALLITWGTYASGESGKKELEYLASPAIGDVYQYKVEAGNYSTLKVVAVSNDSVFVSPNEYAVNKMSGVYKIDKPENYSASSYGISKMQLMVMYQSNDIFDVER